MAHDSWLMTRVLLKGNQTVLSSLAEKDPTSPLFSSPTLYGRCPVVAASTLKRDGPLSTSFGLLPRIEVSGLGINDGSLIPLNLSLQLRENCSRRPNCLKIIPHSEPSRAELNVIGATFTTNPLSFNRSELEPALPSWAPAPYSICQLLLAAA